MELPGTLAELLSVLRENGVTSFSQGELRVEMRPAAVVRPFLKRPTGTPPPERPDAVHAALHPPEFNPDEVDLGEGN